MSVATITIYEAKTHLSRLIAQVEKTGRPVTICRGRKPVVEIVRRRAAKDLRKRDPKLSEVKFFCDPSEPLTAEMWPAEYR